MNKGQVMRLKEEKLAGRALTSRLKQQIKKVLRYTRSLINTLSVHTHIYILAQPLSGRVRSLAEIISTQQAHGVSNDPLLLTAQSAARTNKFIDFLLFATFYPDGNCWQPSNS
jgi:hypothetical protein